MGLTACRECKEQVSTQARTCPHCGAPRPGRHEWNGSGYEWKSQTMVLGYPLVHIAFGRDADGHLRVAKGVIAIGQFAIGLISIAQFGIGVLFGFGQCLLGLTALAQVAVSALFGVGQIAIGYAAIGQVVLAHYGLGQTGLATYLWSTEFKDPQAVEFFTQLARQVVEFFGS